MFGKVKNEQRILFQKSGLGEQIFKSLPLARNRLSMESWKHISVKFD